MFSTCPAFVTGLVDSLGSDFHGVSMALAFVAALVHQVDRFESEFQWFSALV